MNELRNARARRTRLRRKLGRMCARVEIGADEIDWLVRNGFLADDVVDPQTIGDAIARVMATLATSRAAVPKTDRFRAIV